MAACANASNDTILRSLFLIRHGFPPSSSCPTLRSVLESPVSPRENPREIIEKIQEEEEGTIVGPFDSKTRALPSVHDAHFHRSFHAYSWRVFNAVSTYRFKGKWPGISNNRATCSSLILRDSPRSASIIAPSIRRNMCIRAAISPLPEVYHHCIEAGKRCRCITVITTRSGNRTTEKPYPQFLRPFRERFYLQSTGFTNRVAHRFFLSQPFYDPRTIASISNCCKSILCYYLACYLTDETYHVENGIARKQYHYNFERTNTVYDIRGYEVKRKEKKRKGIYSTVVQDRPLLTFEFRTIKGKEQKGNRSDRKPFRVSRELEKSDTTGFAKSKSARWPRSTTIVPSPVSRDFIESA